MARPATTQPAAPGTAGKSPGGQKEVVLLVEDDDSVRLVTRRMLEFRGMLVLPVADPATALQLSEKHADRLDVLVTDVHMPGMDGPELVDQIRVGRPGLRVVYMSGYPEDEVFGSRAPDHRAVFLQKPFTPAQLSAALARSLAIGAAPDSPTTEADTTS
jgi:two-component system cell cycle sensor histidine kinase/response regulator CckA